ncbi:glycyl-tRNA synthetase beta subunit domain protein [Streptococcus pneumoniae 2071247]|nr:glycyl-tRNA synthetase beta subunit domain protein [Streptococcus pneumoniae 2071247]
MTKNLLVELGLEELPAYVVTPSEKQLGEKMAAFLKENRLSFEAIQTFSTPRRLAVRVTGLSDKQSDLTEDFKGPAKKLPWIVMETSPKQLKDLSVEKA